jgi:cyanate lyase
MPIIIGEFRIITLYKQRERMSMTGGENMYKIEMLEKKRLEKGLSYTDIADKLGIHKVTVSRTLNGVTMKPRTVKLLADYLGVEMAKITQ